jgi:D-alanyl-D-alanine carboxypeptidase
MQRNNRPRAQWLALTLCVAALPLAIAAGCTAAPPPIDEEETDGPEPTGDLENGVTFKTVGEAVSGSCSTSSVKGLSAQIIAEGQCIKPDAYAAVPVVGGVVMGSNINAFIQKPARDALVAAAKANPNKKMTVNSMLRTVAQQYLLYRWYQNGTCGIALAAKPGNSNHETGLAMDISEYSSWRSILEAKGFKWHGSSDAVHFDYKGAGSVNYKGIDVQAFQRLWNRNNPKDRIDEDGAWGPMTEARMKKAPAAGFAIGPDCEDEDPDPNNPDPDPDPQACAEFKDAAFTCSADGNSRGQCLSGEQKSEACSRGCLIDKAGDDVCMGTTTTWSCGGTWGTTKAANGDYYTTAFGCWKDANGTSHQDAGDNCIPACLSQAKSSGLCAGMTGPQCEESVNWYAADAGRFGCLARLRVTNPANGKSVVVVALDYGPNCSIEKQVSHAAIDMSSPANQYLFGSDQGIVDKAKVHVVEVAASTPLGPVVK